MNPNDPRIRETMQAFDGLDPNFKQLFGESDNEIANLAAAALPPEPAITIESSGEASPVERAQTDARLAFSQIFGDTPENVCLTESLSPEGKQMAGLTPTQKTLSPELQRAAEKFANSFVDRFIASVASGGSAAKSAGRELQKSAGGKTPIPIAPKLFKQFLAERAAEDPDVDPALISFLQAHAKGDEAGMRASARQFAAEVA